MFSVEARSASAPNAGTVILRDIRNGNVLLLADVAESQSCKAEAQLRGSNLFWQSWAKRAQIFATDPQASCPFI